MRNNLFFYLTIIFSDPIRTLLPMPGTHAKSLFHTEMLINLIDMANLIIKMLTVI